MDVIFVFFFFQAEDGIRDRDVTGVQTCALPISFTSEAKEAVAHYPEITREIQLAAQECGRKLAAHIRKKKHLDYQASRRSLFELYIQEVAQAIGKITKKSPD